MTCDFELPRRKLFLVKNRRGLHAVPTMRSADKWPVADFPTELTKVEVISVDTAGKEVPSQEGI
jgi:hypothetical protein